MTREEAIAYFIDSNERIISVAKDENRYNYETQQIEDVFMRKDFEAKDIAIKALEQEPRKDEVILTKEEYGELVSSEFDNGYTKGYTEALEQNDALDKIRAEIKGLSPKPTIYDIVDRNQKKDAVWETVNDVLQIIDKYRESEG